LFFNSLVPDVGIPIMQ